MTRHDWIAWGRGALVIFGLFTNALMATPYETAESTLLLEPMASCRDVVSANAKLSIVTRLSEYEQRQEYVARVRELYQAHRFLGKGMYGAAYLGRMPETPLPGCPFRPYERVVIKIPHEGWTAADSVAHEATMISELPRSRHLVRAFFDRVSHVLIMPAYLMEYEPGVSQSLRQWMAKHKRRVAQLARAANFRGQIFKIRSLLRGARIVHSDFKPENIVVTPGENLVAIDFGLASRMGDRPLFLYGARGGTEGYQSPNVLANGPASFGDDDFSLNVILRELGQPPL